MSAPAALFDRFDHGVSVIDTGFVRPRFDAAYLIVDEGRAAFIDTGTNHTVPRLMAAIVQHGLQPEDVQWLIVTHIHLDHAGGAGLLMQHLPNATLVVHSRGAGHLCDPSRLMAGVRAVYGDAAVQRDYGELVPVPQERIATTCDGMELRLGGRSLRFLDTPGHSRHHHCVWDEASGGIFTGDTLGVSYEAWRQGDALYALPSSSPVQFDPVALRSSITRLVKLRPRSAFITHYGRIDDVQRQADIVLRQIDPMVRAAATASGPGLRSALGDLYFREAGRAGVQLQRGDFDALVAGDVALNAQGLEVWRASPSLNTLAQ